MPKAEHMSGGCTWVMTVVTASQGSPGHGPRCPETLGYHGEQTPAAATSLLLIKLMPKWNENIIAI